MILKSKSFLSTLLIPIATMPLISCELIKQTVPSTSSPSNAVDSFEINKPPNSSHNSPRKQKEVSYNLSYELIKKQNYKLDTLIPHSCIQKNRIDINGVVDITWVLFSILYHHSLDKETKIKKLEDFISSLKNYKNFLDTNKYLDADLKEANEFLKENDYIKELEKPDWYSLDLDYKDWLNNKFLKDYQYFPISRIKEGDLSSLSKKEKQAIKNQSQDLLYSSYATPLLILSIPKQIEKIKQQVNFLISFSSLNLFIFKNRDKFLSLKELKEFLKESEIKEIDEIKGHLKNIFLVENNIFSQSEDEKTKEIINAYFSILGSETTNDALFFNDALQLLEIIINPLLSIIDDNNYFEKSFPKEYEYFEKYLYKKTDENTNITFYNPSFLDDKQKHHQKLIDYLNSYLRI